MDNLTELVDEVMYRSYKFQRDSFPNIDPERWTAVYGQKSARLMEIRYLRENELLAQGVSIPSYTQWLQRSE